MQWLLHKKDFNVIFINEHLTSSRCSLCHNSVQKFLKHLPSRSRRKNLSPSLVHDIIKCQSDKCRLALREKNQVWNRDLLTTLNFRRILKGYRNEGERSTDLSRVRSWMSFTKQMNEMYVVSWITFVSGFFFR